jgi:hypothetical protein
MMMPKLVSNSMQVRTAQQALDATDRDDRHDAPGAEITAVVGTIAFSDIPRTIHIWSWILMMEGEIGGVARNSAGLLSARCLQHVENLTVHQQRDL